MKNKRDRKDGDNTWIFLFWLSIVTIVLCMAGIVYISLSHRPVFLDIIYEARLKD